jgi:hypothetical protein
LCRRSLAAYGVPVGARRAACVNPTSSPRPARRKLRVVLAVSRAAAVASAWTAAALLTAWSAAALWFDVRVRWLSAPLAIAYVAAILAAVIAMKARKRAQLACIAGFVVVLAWWLTLEPSNDREWQRDVAVLPRADVDGNRVTIHDIRNCEYRSETDYDVRHYDRTFDLEKLRTVDLFVVYWGSPMIAHTMVSFGFDDGAFVCMSIETRKEKGEEYSALRGFFRQFELTYVVADERDLVRLRTNFRHEDVFLYRLHAPPDMARGFFLEYVARINKLHAQPEWYNALTSNCTSNIRGHARPFMQDKRWDWRFVFNGHLDELVYKRGALGSALPFGEWKRSAYIDPLAQAAGSDADFSRRIRAHLGESTR